MPKFAANLSFLYSDLPFEDRVAAAAADGFDAVEYMSPYEFEPADLRRGLDAAGMRQALFNLPFGDWAAGERGIACLPDRVGEFETGVETALRYAEALSCPAVNCLAGIPPRDIDREQAEAVLASNLGHAAARLADAGVKLLLEPINTYDVPGFLISTTDRAEAVFRAVKSDNLYLQYDFYHLQIMQGDLIPTFLRLQNRIGHVQIADHPGRHEPGTGEINYPYIFEELDKAGYHGFVGCEYKPAGDTSAGLSWMRPGAAEVAA